MVCSDVTSALAQRQMERLGRGLIALRSTTTQIYVGWRLLGNDPGDIGFNLYRSANGGPAVMVNTLPLTNTTDYVDTPANLATTAYTYSVKPVLNGVEVPDIWANPLAPPAVLPANAPVRQYLSVPIQSVPQYPGDATDTSAYNVKFCWVGDLDGDGEYDFVVDRTSVDSTNTHRQYVDAYKHDGTFLWRVNMGSNSLNQDNISPGSAAISTGMWDGVEAYDMDGDGKAEGIIKAANDTRLPDGTIVTNSNTSVQYLIVLDGMTGVERARIQWPTDYISDGPMGMSFAIAYLNGVTPSLVVKGKNRQSSGAFNMMVCAFNFNGSVMTQLWKWKNTTCADAHQLRITDVNNDGKDEVLEVPYALNPDGTVLYNLGTQGIAHGDRFHITDMDPDRPGLETFLIQQDNPTLLATALIDTATGVPIKKWYSSGVVDVGRGVALDLDPSHKGCEMFSTQPGVFDCKGNQIFANSAWPPEGLWWDADLGREFIDGAGTGQLSPIVTKFNPSTDGVDRLYSIYQESVWQPYGGRPPFWGDILGDWREELVFCADNYSDLRIYISKITATNRIYCLMQNPQYRCESTVKGYVESSYVDYYLGWGMTQPQPPPQSMSKMVWRGGAGNAWDGSSSNWRTNWFYAGNAYTNLATLNSGDSVLFDLTGSNNTAIALSGALTPGDVTVYAPKDYTFDGSAGSLGGSMKLTKAGAGALTVTGDHTFTGKTTVWDGALLVNGSLQQSPVTVWGGTWGGALAAGKTGGRIGGTGQFGQPVTIKYRGAVSPGAGVNYPGVITFGGGLALEDGSALVLDFSDDPTGVIKTNDLINVTGSLTVTGTNHIVINRLNTNLPPGTVYPLINYSGTLSGSLNNFVVSGLTGISFALTNPPGQIALVVKNYRAPATLTWIGGSGGNAWDLLITSNWLNGATKDLFAPNDTVRFDNTGAVNPTVNLVGDLNAANLIVDSTSNYTFTGSGDLFGSCSLTKTNSGTLTINTVNNTFTGKTTVSGGMLVVSELDAIGFPSPLGNPPGGSTNLVLSGSATLRVTGESYTDRGMTLNTGTNTIDIYNSSAQLTMAGVITGSGALQKLGGGTLALNAVNTFTGPAIIKAGGISFGGGSTVNQYALGPGPGGNGNTTVTLDSGTLTMYSDTSSYDSCYWNIVVPTNSTGTVNGDDRCNLDGSLTGGGTFNFNVYYVRCELGGNWSAFTGQINFGTDSGGGDFRIGNTYGYANAAVNLADYITVYHISGSGVALGAVTGGTFSKMTGTPWTVGAKNTDATYAGSITGNSITKVGTGTWTLTGNTNTYTGVTTISAGTLQIGNGGTAGSIGTGNITDNATLAFNQSDYITDTNSGVISGTGNLAKRGAGRLALTKAHTYSGATTVEAGTLALTNSGAIANSSNIVLSAGALLDVSGTTSGSMTLANGKNISGYGSVKGNFTIGSGATLAPGGSIGTLIFSNALTLAAGCTNYFEISKSPLTNDVAKVFGTLTNGGTLIVTNIGATALAAGDSFKLFNAASYSGTFANIVLPSLPAGLGWNTNGINTNGSLAVVVASKPVIGPVAFSGNSLVMSGSGGVANASYYLLASTNIAKPLSNWARLLTNQFDNNGNFNFTNATGTNAQNYYLLQVP
jgi:autotransporter-associated beta strand protein